MSFLTPGEKLKEIRKALKIRQSEFEKAGVSRNFISMVENNKRKLSSKVALKIFNTINAKKELLNIDMEIDYEYLKLSSKKAAEKYCNENLNTNSPSETINEIIEISKQYKLIDLLIKAYLAKADNLYDKGDFKNSSIYYYDTLELCNSINKVNDKASIYNKIGKCRYGEMNYIEALSLFIKAHELSHKTHDDRTWKLSKFNIALSKKKLGKIDEAIQIINSLLKEDDILNDAEVYTNSMILLANCYKTKSINKSLEIYIDLINSYNIEDNNTLSMILTNIGYAYNDLGEWERAVEYFDRSISLMNNITETHVPPILFGKSTALLNNKLYDEALKYSQDGILVASKYNDLEYIISGYRILEEIYKKLESTENLERVYKDVIHLFVQNF